jgi:hypothetical protein
VKDDLNPQAKEMADESMVRNLAAQAEAIWPQKKYCSIATACPRSLWHAAAAGALEHHRRLRRGRYLAGATTIFAAIWRAAVWQVPVVAGQVV